MADDRISALPDEILLHILSFLPTQTSAATSLLSKRWTPLWLKVPALNFDDQSFLQNNSNNKPYHSFCNFIHKTILARDVTLPIRVFRLQCNASASNFGVSCSDLRIWANAAIQRGLENLHIQLPSTSTLFFQGCIFTCKTLVVFKLNALSLREFFVVNLPSLKTLHLDDVTFPEPRYLMELFYECPILEDMHLRDIGFCYYTIPSNTNFKSLSKLLRANICEIDFDIPLKAICNVEFLRIDKFIDDIPVFPNLTHLELKRWKDMKWHLVLAILKQCSKLQNFVMDTNEIYDDEVWPYPQFVPECLASQLRECSITNYEGTNSELHFAKYILQSSRVLRTMTICTLSSSDFKVDKLAMITELSLSPRSSPICQLSFN